jgi:hypothetical protein
LVHDEAERAAVEFVAPLPEAVYQTPLDTVHGQCGGFDLSLGFDVHMEIRSK